MNTEYKMAVLEGVKEFIRTFILGMVVPIGATLVIINNGINVVVGGFNINWLLAASILASGAVSALNTSFMSAIDKWAHKMEFKTPLDLTAMDKLVKKDG